MKYLIAILISVGLLVSCEDHAHGGHGSHDFDPLHGGQLIHTADHGPILEVVYDQAAGSATVYVFDAHQNPKPIEAAPFLLIPTYKDPIPSTGKGYTWVFKHEELKKHHHDMRFRITIDGKERNPGWHPPH